jgi:hypothetical protein
MAWAVDTMVVRNLIVRNSRMDNPIPEVIASDDIGYAGPGFTVRFDSEYLDAKGVLLENCDDGGIWIGAQTWEYNIVEEQSPASATRWASIPGSMRSWDAPWLSPFSPAIDAGHPDLVYNDIEDPDNPGFALWPSQGTLRNDIGYTGGPYTRAPWNTWWPCANRSPTPARPAAFTLHPAYPNPFNPSTPCPTPWTTRCKSSCRSTTCWASRCAPWLSACRMRGAQRALHGW